MDMVKVIPLMSINFGLLSSLSCLYEIIDNSDKLYLPETCLVYFFQVSPCHYLLINLVNSSSNAFEILW